MCVGFEEALALCIFTLASLLNFGAFKGSRLSVDICLSLWVSQLGRV